MNKDIRPKNDPMFLRFLRKETGVIDLLQSFSQSQDDKTAQAATAALNKPPDLEEFYQELDEAVRDIIRNGIGDEFKDFVNHYMEQSLEEDMEVEKGVHGENRSQIARIKDPDAPWVQGFVCYNLCLYIKAFGMDDLKECKVCGKLFCHKGKWAVYCSEECKRKKKQ